jgi:hypothetical protein
MFTTRLLHGQFILLAFLFILFQPGTWLTAASSPTSRAEGNAVSANGVGNAASLPDKEGSVPFVTGDYSRELGPDAVDAWLQQAKITAYDGAVGDYFGRSVSLTTDGNMALVGANGSNSSTGAAYVFTRTGDIWTHQDRLTASDGANNEYFGYSVDLDGGGNTAIVGAYGKNAAYVFVRSGSTWLQQAKLSSMPEEPEFMGNAVALSADGHTALVAAFMKNSNRGSVYVYTRSSTTWTLQWELTAPNAVDLDYFGISVALSDSGDMALIGAHGRNSNRGAAYVFTRSGAVWSQQAELTASDGSAWQFFGKSTALDSDGTVALVGAYGDNSARGAAYIFSRSGSTWTQQAKLTAYDGAVSDQLGWSASLSASGETALVGAFDLNYPHKAVAYIFTGNGATWAQQAKLTAPVAGENAFGHSVALGEDGASVLVGAPGTYQLYGAAYVFRLSLPIPVVTTSMVSSITQTTATGGGNVTSDGGEAVTARGVCWGTTVNPVATGSSTTDGTGTGIFTSSITGLSALTSYHVRAYATNSAGTAYGEDISFTTNLCTDDVLRGGTSYSTIQDAVTSGSGPEIKTVARTFQESLSFTNSSALTLFGGWACGFGSASGLTTVHGTITIVGSAAVALGNVAVY